MNNKSTGEFIKELRKEKNLSQQKLAEITRIDRTTITKYETGEREPNYYNLEILSKALDVSVTELIAGGREIEDYDKVDNAFKRMFANLHKFKNIVKILITIFIFVITSLIIYITILNYTATRVYRVYTDSETIRITDGILVKTKDRMYLTFSTEVLSNKIDKINIYYKDNDQKEYIYKTSNLESVYIANFIKESEYNNNSIFYNFLRNTYIELEYQGKVVGVEKLIIEFDYSNKNIDNNESDIDIQSINKKGIKKSEVYDLAQKFIITNNNKTYNIKLNGVNYKIYAFDDGINIKFKKKNKEYLLTYSIIDEVEIIVLKKIENISEIIYSYNIAEENCKNTDCSRYKDDLKLIKLLLEEIKK